MEYELPTEFDLIVVGTGLVESVLSAAASRVGKRVLHVDRNNYYGGLWASFNLEATQNLEGFYKDNVVTVTCDSKDIVRKSVNNLGCLKDFCCEWHIPEKGDESCLIKNLQEKVVIKDEETEKKELNLDNPEETKKSLEPLVGEQSNDKKLPDKPSPTQESVLKDSRKFNIDIIPKLQYARGDFVELLISSNIARYTEFRSVSRVLTWINGSLDTVPCSRSDVFANNKVSVIEKRMLMKLLTSIDQEQPDLTELDTKTFKEFLKEKKLSSNLIHYVLYALSMSTDETSCADGIEKTKRFLTSLGRFGKTPFLFSMYGSGEMAQAFCRLSAVFGGIFALNQSLQSYTIDENNKFCGVLCGKQKINADHLVTGMESAPWEYAAPFERKYISRAVVITDKSIMESEREHLTLLLYPPENGRKIVTIVEFGYLTGTCPKDLFLVHFITEQVSNPKEDLQHCISNLFKLNTEGDNEKPAVLWSCYFSIPEIASVKFNEEFPSNIFVCPGPDSDLDYDFSIKKAKDIFKKMYPDEEFLPRAPDADEIIIGDEENENKEENSEEAVKSKTKDEIENQQENLEKK